MLSLFFIDSTAFSEVSTNKQITEDHDTHELNKVLSDYNKDQEKVLKDVSQLSNQAGATGRTEDDIDVETSKPLLNENKLPGIFKPQKKLNKINEAPKVKYSEQLRLALVPLQSMKEEQLVFLLQENTKGTQAYTYIEKFPILALYAVRLIKDKDALPLLAKTLDNQEKYLKFVSCMISTFIFSFFLKRFLKRDGRTIIKSVSFWFVRFILVTLLRVWILFFFFTAEITPALNITTKTFFNF
jgi:hypothetical protein